MPALDQLTIEITAETSKATTKINNLAKALNGLRNASSSLSETATAFSAIKADKIQKIAEVVASVGVGINSFARGVKAIGDSMAEAEVKAGRFEKLVYGLNDATKAIDLEALKPLVEFSKTIGTAGSKMGTFLKSLNGLVEFSQKSGNMEAVLGTIDKLLNKLTERAPEIAELSESLSEVIRALKTIGKVNDLGEAVGKTQKPMERVSKSSHNFAKSLAMMPINAFKNKVEGLIKPIGNLWRSFKRIAMYRALRTALKEITQGFATGVKNLYAWSGLVGNSFKGTMDSLATSLNYMRNSLGAMVSPLLDALAPAVDILVDKFVDLVNLVNQFFATITGKTSWRKALKTQKEYADNTNDAAAAQAKLNHQLMAFDELNNISTSSPSGRGGGGSDDGVSADDFEEMELPDWAQDIKDAIDRGDWAGAGEALAEKLNGVIDNWNSSAAGGRLGAKFESALEFYNSAMDNFKWDKLGTKLAGFVNGFVNKIDPKQLGDAMTAAVEAGFEFLANFVPKVDLSNIALAFSTAINNLFSDDNSVNVGKTIAGVINKGIEFLKTMITGGYIERRLPGTDEVYREWVDGIDFEQVGYGLFEAIGTAIQNIKWEDLGTVIQKLAGGFVDMINGAFNWIKEHPDDVKNAVSDFFKGLWGEDGKGFKNLLNAALIVAGLKLAFTTVFGNAGLIATVKQGVSGLFEAAGFGGGAAFPLTVGILLAVNLIGDVVDNIKTYGYPEGLFKTLGKDANFADFFAGSLAGATVPALIGEALYKIKVDMETEYLKKKLASKPVQNAIKFINAMLRLAGLEEIKIDFDFPGLEQGRKDSYNLDNNLGGLKKTYTTTVNAKNLTGNTTNANKYKTALVDVDGKTYRTTVSTSGLTGNTKNATSYKDNLEGIKGKTYSSTVKTSGLTTNSENSTTLKDNLLGMAGKTIKTVFSALGLDSGAEEASTVQSSLTGVNNKTFWTTLSSSTLTDAANSAKKLYDNLNNSAKTWTVKVNGQIELTDPGKKYKLEASGGYVSAGTAFIAGEAGPELVGTINGRTGVVSANEISGIGDAIYNTGETEAALLAEQNALLRQILAKTGITLTPNAAAGKWVAQAQTAYARATGG